ncbi:hypothetical protein ACTA71_004078, partial [Dictyostelium dimigraforme]
IAHNF